MFEPPTRLVLGNLGSWTHASAVVYAAESYDPKATLQALEMERCTGVHGVPTHFLGLLGELERSRKEDGRKWDLSSLRYEVHDRPEPLRVDVFLSPALA